MNRNAWAEKPSASCDPNSKRFDSSADFPLYSAAAGEQPLAFLIDEPIGEPGAACRASVVVMYVIHCR